MVYLQPRHSNASIIQTFAKAWLQYHDGQHMEEGRICLLLLEKKKLFSAVV